MKRFITISMLFVLVALATPHFILAAKVGQPAPDFTGTASNNQTYHLADFRGKFVVLEWHNNGCPYTQKHYMSGNMQKLQKQWTAQGVIIYDGAIDNRPTDDVKDIAGATNYLNVALGQALAGKPVETAATRPYGCSVKYKGSWF